MEKLENLDQNELMELWQELQYMTHEETGDCGDVALLCIWLRDQVWSTSLTKLLASESKEKASE
jgi:hypothetical protein